MEKMHLVGAEEAERVYMEKIAAEESSRELLAKDGGGWATGLPGRHYTLSELLQVDIPDPGGFLGGNMMNPGQMSIIAGMPGAGKSFLTNLLALKLARGERFGPLATKKGRVLYISQEMNEAIPKRRLERLLPPDWTPEDDQELRLVFQPNFDLYKPEGRKALYDMVKFHEAKVVFIDCLAMVHTAEESSNDQMGPWLGMVLQRTCMELGVHVCFIHHFKKQFSTEKDDLRGATCLKAMMDTILFMVKDQEMEGSGILRVNKIRDGAGRPPLRYEISDGLDGRILIDFQEAS